MTVSDISWNPDESIIAIGHYGPHIELYGAKEFDYLGYMGASLEEIIQQRQSGIIENTINNLVWIEDGMRLASGSSDGFITIWDVSSGDFIYQFENSTTTAYIYDVWFSNHDNYVSSIANDGLFKIWKIDNGNLLLNSDLGVRIAYSLVSLDKTKLAYVDDNNELHIVEINDLITAPIRLKITECVADDEFHTQLNDFLDNDENTGFINQLEAADLNTISRECADTLLEMATLLLEAK